MVLGVGHSVMAEILAGSMETPSELIMYPRKEMVNLVKGALLSFNEQLVLGELLNGLANMENMGLA